MHHALQIRQQISRLFFPLSLGIAEERGYKSGDGALYKQARNKLTKEIGVAKMSHREEVKKKKNSFSANNSVSVWRGPSCITNYPRLPRDVHVLFVDFRLDSTPSSLKSLMGKSLISQRLHPPAGGLQAL